MKPRKVSIRDATRLPISGWHDHPTSACFGSFPSARRQRLTELVAALPARESIAGLREQGFTTLLLHQPEGRYAAPLLHEFERAARLDALQGIERTDALSAFVLLPVAEPAR